MDDTETRIPHAGIVIPDTVVEQAGSTDRLPESVDSANDLNGKVFLTYHESTQSEQWNAIS
jgi:hypothetical protein